MSAQRECERCHAELRPGVRFCSACGTPRAASSGGAGFRGLLWIGALLVLVLSGAAFFFWKRVPDAAKDEHVAAELLSSVDRPALEIPGVMRVLYVDRGASIELTIESKSNPVLYFDVNQNHVVDKGDVSYSALPGNRVCITAMEGSECNSLGSSASVQVRLVGDETTVTWKISKAELGGGKESADVAIRTFHEKTQQGDYYPGNPFQTVYRLMFRGGGESGTDGLISSGPLPAEKIEPVKTVVSPPMPGGGHATETAPVPEITQFEAAPNAIQAGGTTRLKWAVKGSASAVEIRPEVGIVTAQGEREVTPGATTRYLLTAKGVKGVTTRELTVAVGTAPAPIIASFSSDSSQVGPGGTVHLRWNVTGAVTSVKIDPMGSGLPAAGSREAVVTQTTNFVLTAEGPGGTVSNTLAVRAAPLAPAAVFDATPASVRAGEAVVLHWAVSGAAQVSIQPAFGEVAASGSEAIHPLVTTQYTLVANVAGGNVVKTVTVNVARFTGPSKGQLVWSGVVHGVQLVTIDRDHADVGELEGALPGEPCIVQPMNPKNVSIASSPGPRNQYQRVVLRIKGEGQTRVVVGWSLQ